jgi:drug/metabolite transporter (DMT)-like permease
MSVFLPLFAVLIWSANTVVAKAAAAVFAPEAISFYRWLIAAIVLTPFCLRSLLAQRQAIRPYLPRFAALALLGMVINQCLAYYAAHSTSATNMGVLTALIPLIGVLMSSLLFRQRIGMQTLLGVALSFAGVVYLLGRGHPAGLLDAGVGQGDVLMLTASSAYALYSILLKRWPMPFDPWLNLYVQVLLAVVMLAPVAMTASSLAIPARGVAMVLFAGIGSSVLAAFCWMRAVHRNGAERTGVYMNLLPLITALIACVTLGETIQHYHWLGGSAILAGVVLAQGGFPLAGRWRRALA